MHSIKRYTRHFLSLFVLIVCSLTAAAQPAPDALARFIERGMAQWHVPGMAVAVVSSEETLFMRGFGETATVSGRAVNEHTLFAIASTTKAMVDAGLLMLADEGRLSLDDRVVKHLPELHFSDPLLTAQVTLLDLMAHRTGLPGTDFWTFFQGMPLSEQIQRLGAVEPQAGLRSRLIYQNTMYELLGEVIRRVSGQRWDRFLRERLWRPIGMQETFGTRAEIREGLVRVSPSFYRDGELTAADWDFPAEHADAAGSVWSSAHDMALWARFLLRGGVTEGGKRLLSKESFRAMFSAQNLIAPADFYPTAELTAPHWTSYGLGWFQQDFQGRRIDFHTGSLSGLIALIGLDRDNDRAVVVLGNRDHAEMRHAVLWEVMDHSAADTRRDWNGDIFELYEKRRERQRKQWREQQEKRLPGTRPSLPLERYAGRYESPVIGPLTIARSGDTLRLIAARRELALSHWHLDTFVAQYTPWELHEFVTFRVAPNGAISGFEAFGQTFRRVAAKSGDQ